mmetsp:Transcript_9380/g.11294  ORF Transcript_9380/g.11294 Transcript_9380/m.11294 type:complete len:341 (+) Transcript_9380:947-1969(+)
MTRQQWTAFVKDTIKQQQVVSEALKEAKKLEREMTQELQQMKEDRKQMQANKEKQPLAPSSPDIDYDDPDLLNKLLAATSKKRNPAKSKHLDNLSDTESENENESLIHVEASEHEDSAGSNEPSSEEEFDTTTEAVAADPALPRVPIATIVQPQLPTVPSPLSTAPVVVPPQLPTVPSPLSTAAATVPASTPSATSATALLIASLQAVSGGAAPSKYSLLELFKKTTPVTAQVTAQYMETLVVRNNSGDIQVFFKVVAPDGTELKVSAWGATVGTLYGCDAISFHRVWTSMKETQGVGMSDADLMFLLNAYAFCGQSATPQPKDFIIKFTGKFFNFVRYA